MARVHSKASKFGFNPSSQGNRFKVCPCCYNIVESEEIGFCYPTTKISIEEEAGFEEFKLTSAASLYFSFIKMVIIYFFLRFLLCDGFNLYSNIVFGSKCKSLEKDVCEDTIWNFASAINLDGNEQTFWIQDILNLAIIVLSLIYFFIYRKRQYSINKMIGKNRQT